MAHCWIDFDWISPLDGTTEAFNCHISGCKTDGKVGKVRQEVLSNLAPVTEISVPGGSNCKKRYICLKIYTIFKFLDFFFFKLQHNFLHEFCQVFQDAFSKPWKVQSSWSLKIYVLQSLRLLQFCVIGRTFDENHFIPMNNGTNIPNRG